MRFLMSVALFLALSSSVFAAEKAKVYCVFLDEIEKGGANYVTQYVMAGSLEANEMMLNLKSTEFAVAKIGGKYRVNWSDVNNKNNLLASYRRYTVSSKNNNSEWKTYVNKNEVNDGYIVRIAITLSNKDISGQTNGQSYKALLSLTTQTDDAPYTSKVPGTCTLD